MHFGLFTEKYRMPNIEAEKELAAKRAVAEIQNGMSIGLGTGSTMAYAIRELGRRVAGGLQITAAATSEKTVEAATLAGIAITPFEQLAHLDLAIDGADEVDPSLRAIKGGGGALLREKIVASATDRVIIIVDSSKPVNQLGSFQLPVEVLPFAKAFAFRKLAELGAPVTQRLKPDSSPFLSDQGAYIFTIDFGVIADPKSIALQIDAIPGIIEHGLFLSEIDEVFIGRGTDVEIIKRSP